MSGSCQGNLLGVRERVDVGVSMRDAIRGYERCVEIVYCMYGHGVRQHIGIVRERDDNDNDDNDDDKEKEVEEYSTVP